MRVVAADGHVLQVGKRPSLQVVRGYGRVMYMVRPKGNVQLKYRSLTMSELMDFCSNITGEDFARLRSEVDAGAAPGALWKGVAGGTKIELYRVTSFTYLVTGLAPRALFFGQVELAGLLGMDGASILSRLVPVQDRWMEAFTRSPVFNAAFPSRFPSKEPDALVEWIVEHYPSP